MTRASAIVVVAAAAGVLAAGAPASAQSVSIRAPQSIVARAATSGDIHGLVVDIKGRPLPGAMVSALGSTVAFAMTGRDGRFRLDALPIGEYTVRIHLEGFVPAPRQMVEVRAAGPALVSVALRSLTDSSASGTITKVVAAGMLPVDLLPVSGDQSGDADHDHTEATWRLRHLVRSVLKDVDGQRVADANVGDDTPEETARAYFGRTSSAASAPGSGLFDLLPLTGQVNLVTIGSFNGPSDMWSTNSVASAGVAYLSIGAPVGALGDWALRGAMTQGGLGSWFVAGTLTAHQAAAHRYIGGITYSSQRYDRSSALGVFELSTGTRSVGTVYGSDEWTLSPKVALGYGLAYAWQDYLSGNGLLSPRVSVTVSPTVNFRVRAVAARYVVAPGSEEFLPGPVSGGSLLLPAQRTFSPWSERQGFRAEQTNHFELALERNISAYVIGFRTFYQRVEDQSAAVFAAATPDRPVPSLGHYYIASVGDMNSAGWSVSLRRALIRGVKGSVDYSQTTTLWDPPSDLSTIKLWTAGRQNDRQRLHDLTTSLETEIRPTATRVYILYKLDTGFVRQTATRSGSGFDTRFDVQVNQALPFLNFTSADWELLVAVCNLFRDSTLERSPYDELLVVRPPKRVVGGLRVRF